MTTDRKTIETFKRLVIDVMLTSPEESKALNIECAKNAFSAFEMFMKIQSNPSHVAKMKTLGKEMLDFENDEINAKIVDFYNIIGFRILNGRWPAE